MIHSIIQIDVYICIDVNYQICLSDHVLRKHMRLSTIIFKYYIWISGLIYFKKLSFQLESSIYLF